MKFILQPFYKAYRYIIRHPKYRWIVILGSLFYLLSPLDIISDAIPIFGWIDDGVIVTLLITEVSTLLLEKRQQAKLEKKESATS